MLLNIFKVLCTTLLTDTVLIPSMYHYRMCLPVDYSEALTQTHDCHHSPSNSLHYFNNHYSNTFSSEHISTYIRLARHG